MLINLNGNIVNYNNIQSVTPGIVHVDFIERTVTNDRYSKFFEITVQSKISFTIEVLDPTTGRCNSYEFMLEMSPNAFSNDSDGETSRCIANGLTPLPTIGCDLTSGTFHYRSAYPKKAWKIAECWSEDGDEAETDYYDQPSSEEIKAFKNTMQAKIRQGLPHELLKAVNKMAQTCLELN